MTIRFTTGEHIYQNLSNNPLVDNSSFTEIFLLFSTTMKHFLTFFKKIINNCQQHHHIHQKHLYASVFFFCDFNRYITSNNSTFQISWENIDWCIWIMRTISLNNRKSWKINTILTTSSMRTIYFMHQKWKDIFDVLPRLWFHITLDQLLNIKIY